jgi:hypothetical protein
MGIIQSVFIKNNLIGGVRIHNAQQKTRIMKDFLKFALAVYLLGLIIGIIESL